MFYVHTQLLRAIFSSNKFPVKEYLCKVYIYNFCDIVLGKLLGQSQTFQSFVLRCRHDSCLAMFFMFEVRLKLVLEIIVLFFFVQSFSQGAVVCVYVVHPSPIFSSQQPCETLKR